MKTLFELSELEALTVYVRVSGEVKLLSVKKVARQIKDIPRNFVLQVTTRKHRSRRERWTTRIHIALGVFFRYHKLRIFEPPEGTPNVAGHMGRKRIGDSLNRFI